MIYLSPNFVGHPSNQFYIYDLIRLRRLLLNKAVEIIITPPDVRQHR